MVEEGVQLKGGHELWFHIALNAYHVFSMLYDMRMFHGYLCVKYPIPLTPLRS
jgi:hypothetical protein